MKKTAAFIVFFFSCVFITNIMACPIEGPNMPNNKLWKTDVQINSMFGADMKKPGGKLESTQYFLTSSYGITKYLRFDGKLGVGDVTFDIKDSQKIHYPTNFAGGYGGRLLLYDNKENGVNCIFGMHHISVHPNSVKIDGVKHEAIVDEWQGSLLVSKKIERFRPYVAAKFSKIYLIRKVDGARKRIQPEDDLGLVLGLAFNIKDNARLNLEGRLFDEDSLTVGFNYAF